MKHLYLKSERKFAFKFLLILFLATPCFAPTQEQLNEELRTAERSQEYGLVKDALDAGGDPSAVFLFDVYKPEILDLLIEKGADTSIKNSKGKTIFEVIRNRPGFEVLVEKYVREGKMPATAEAQPQAPAGPKKFVAPRGPAKPVVQEQPKTLPIPAAQPAKPSASAKPQAPVQPVEAPKKFNAPRAVVVPAVPTPVPAPIKKVAPPIVEIVADNQPQRGIIVLIDESEKNFSGAMSEEFLTALEGQAGPILVTSFLFNTFLKRQQAVQNMMKRKSADYQKNPLLQIVDLVHSIHTEGQITDTEKKSILDSINIIVNNAIAAQYKAMRSLPYEQVSLLYHHALVANSTFKPEDWLILNAASDSMYLMIPNSFIEKIVPGYRSGQPVDRKFALSLGLNVDAMPQIPSVGLTEYISKNAKNIPNKQDFAASLNKIFVLNADYYKENRSADIPAWTIFLSGHGDIESLIVGLPLSAFPNILSFFDEKINTRLLVYLSCYAAGANAEKIYADLKQPGAQKLYSYAIITAALTDEPVTGHGAMRLASKLPLTVDEIDWKNHTLKFTLPYDFRLFFDRAFSSDVPVFYEKIIEPVLLLASQESLGKTTSLTAAQIRFPGLPWFSVVDAQNRVVSIGRILATTRGANPLNIKAFFKQQNSSSETEYPAAILLYTHNVPFILDMTGIPADKLPRFVSMVPGRATHKLAGIKLGPGILVTALAPSLLFSEYVYEQACKTFLIEEVQMMLEGEQNSVSNMLSDCHLGGEKIYFEADGDLFKVVKEKNNYKMDELHLNSPDAQQYRKLLGTLTFEPGVQTQKYSGVAEKLKKIFKDKAGKE